jgi:hypothetical protein
MKALKIVPTGGKSGMTIFPRLGQIAVVEGVRGDLLTIP